MREMYESISIIFQIISNFNLNEKNKKKNTFFFYKFLFNKKFNSLNKNSEYNSMESLINHFKHFSDGLPVNKGFSYKAVEAPKGELGVSVVSDGSPRPFRCKLRTPAYHHMQMMPRLVQGHFFADLVTVLGSQDIVFGDVDR